MSKQFFISMNDLQRKVSLFGRLHAVVLSRGSCPGLLPLCWDDNRHTGQILEKNWGQLTNNKGVQWCPLIRLVSMVTNAMTTEFCHCCNDWKLWKDKICYRAILLKGQGGAWKIYCLDILKRQLSNHWTGNLKVRRTWMYQKELVTWYG